MWTCSLVYLILLHFVFPMSYHPDNSTTVRIWPLDISNLLSVDFEIQGIVQGVNFREFTREKARSRQIRGFVTNTKNGTVMGHLEGDEKDIKHMGKWLSENSKNYSLTLLKYEKLKEYNYKHFAIQGFLLTIRAPPTPRKKWLREEGSPLSSIRNAVFYNEMKIKNHTYVDFDIVR